MKKPARILGALPSDLLRSQISNGALRYRVGPFIVQVESSAPQVVESLQSLYHDFPLAEESDYRDFRLAIRRPSSLRRWIRPYAEFCGDGDAPFTPIPLDSAFPLLEWGFNWRVATTAHQYLMLHAAVIERNGITVLMPALPGSGKSTLCAALICRGWRLLSDEFGLVRPGSIEFEPFPRCVPLKNESIQLIKSFEPTAVLGPVFEGTRKGDVAHLKPPRESVERAAENATVNHIVFPHFESGVATRLFSIEKARAFMKVSSNSFNYDLMGVAGFRTVGEIVEASECHLFHYSDLDQAIAVFDNF